MSDQLHQLSAQFVHLTSREKQLIEDAFTFRQVPKNFLLVREGQVTRELYFINKGLLRLYFQKGGEGSSFWRTCSPAATTASCSDPSASSFWIPLKTASCCRLPKIKWKSFTSWYPGSIS